MMTGYPKRVALPLPWLRILRRDRSHDATRNEVFGQPQESSVKEYTESGWEYEPTSYLI